MRALLKLVAQDLFEALREGVILSGVAGCPGLTFEYRVSQQSADQAVAPLGRHPELN